MKRYARLFYVLALRYAGDPRLVVRAFKRVVAVFRQSGVQGLLLRLRSAATNYVAAPISYDRWIAAHDVLTEDAIADLRKRIAAIDRPPLISVLMPTYDTPDALLREAIDSVRRQIYEHWELCIADDCSKRPSVGEILRRYAGIDSRIKVVFRAENGHISKASNSALELVTGEWVAMLDHDDVLQPNALAEVALEIERHPDARADL